MCKKLSCLAIALIVAGAVILVGTTIGLSVYFANKVVEEEDKGNPGKVTTPTGPVPGPPGPKPPAPPGPQPPAPPGPQPPAPPGPQPPAPPGPQPPAPKPVVWVGGPQNEVKGLPELLGTEFIEYKRDMNQWNREANYAEWHVAHDASGLLTDSKLKAWPLHIDGVKMAGNDVAAQKRMRDALEAAAARWSEEGGKKSAKLRFVAETVHAEEKPTAKRMIKTQNLAHDLITSGHFAAKAGAKVKPSEIAIVVSADPSRAGGVTSKVVDAKPQPARVDNFLAAPEALAPTSQAVDITKIHNGHDDQEGSLISNWYVHQVNGFPRPRVVDHELNAQAKQVVKLFEKLLRNTRGLKDLPSSEAELSAGNYETYQGVDYVNTKNPISFGDCWVVRNPKIGEERANPALFNADGKQDENQMVSAAQIAYPMIARKAKAKSHKIGAFLFVPTPIARSVTTRPHSTLVNEYAQTNFNFFLASLQASVAAALDAAIQEQLAYGNDVKVLVLDKLAGRGAHWPDAPLKRHRIRGKKNRDSKPKKLGGGATMENYRKVIDAALDEMVEVKGVAGLNAGEKLTLPKRAFFEDVVMTHDGQN